MIWNRIGENNKLGFAVQLVTVRFLLTFLSYNTYVQKSVFKYLYIIKI
ncbi:DUF4158 domain-containing protein [Bacillus cereus]